MQIAGSSALVNKVAIPVHGQLAFFCLWLQWVLQVMLQTKPFLVRLRARQTIANDCFPGLSAKFLTTADMKASWVMLPS